jgi:hypothetical protein
MFLIGAIPAVLMPLLRVLLPESPRWLASRGRRKEAEQAGYRQLRCPSGLLNCRAPEQAILTIEQAVEKATGRILSADYTAHRSTKKEPQMSWRDYFARPMEAVPLHCGVCGSAASWFIMGSEPGCLLSIQWYSTCRFKKHSTTRLPQTLVRSVHRSSVFFRSIAS